MRSVLDLIEYQAAELLIGKQLKQPLPVARSVFQRGDFVRAAGASRRNNSPAGRI